MDTKGVKELKFIYEKMFFYLHMFLTPKTRSRLMSLGMNEKLGKQHHYGCTTYEVRVEYLSGYIKTDHKFTER